MGPADHRGRLGGVAMKLSSIIALVAALFFLFMACGSFWTMVTTGGKDGEWYLTALVSTITFLVLAWGAASLGDI